LDICAVGRFGEDSRLHREAIAGLTMGRIPFKIVGVWPMRGRGRIERDGEDVALALLEARDALDRVNEVMNAYRTGSDLSRLNAAAASRPVKVDADLLDVLATARQLTSLTDGAFDPTGRPVFELWKSAGANDRVPTDEEIATARALSGWDKLAWNQADRTVVKSAAGVAVDLGAIAKGHAVDRAIDRLKRLGLSGGLVEVGGEVRVFGLSPNAGQWLVGIQHPFRLSDDRGKPNLWGKLAVSEGAVATSGNYRRSSTIQGRRHSHIIDPRTGRPADRVASVTVIAEDCTTADAWATALSVLAPEALAKIETVDGIEAMMILGEPGRHQQHSTSGFDRYVRDSMPAGDDEGT
jgi:thiamine biosynthesis lipoprotein